MAGGRSCSAWHRPWWRWSWRRSRRRRCRLPDLILVVGDGAQPRQQLLAVGFESSGDAVAGGDTAFRHPGANLPAVLLREGNAAGRVGSASRWSASPRSWPPRRSLPRRPARRWRPCGWRGCRRGRAWSSPRWSVAGPPALCRWTRHRSAPSRCSGPWNAGRPGCAMTWMSGWRWTRRWRWRGGSSTSWEPTAPPGRTRGRAGQLGAAPRQPGAAGAPGPARLGWANHDHHTFRSSRKHFPTLITILETLGFVPRERFHAGSEARWRR